MSRRLGLGFIVAFLCLHPTAKAEESLIDRSLEDLLETGLSAPPTDVQSSTAAKYSQYSTSAPATIHIATAEDIKTYGWRTFAEILRSFPGVFSTNDRTYAYLGVRGFNRPGDFGSRVLLLIDGERVNDNIYDSGYYGNDFPVDVDLIERVEFSPGPGSAVYGNNAFFGTVNVITKRGHALNGGELSAEYRSYGTYKIRGSYGKRFENGIEALISATGFDRQGIDKLYYPEFDTPAQNHGQAVGLDYDRNHSIFAKLNYGGLLLEGGYVERTNGIPTAAYDVLFNNPASKKHDQIGFIMLQYEAQTAKNWGLNFRLGYHRVQYDGFYPYDYPPYTLNRDLGKGEWWDTELRLVNNSLERHRLMFGVEFQLNTQQYQREYDIGGAVYLNKPYDSVRYGFYLQDEFRLWDSLTLLLGARYDYNPLGQRANPRVALVWQPLSATTLKLMYGTAFRAPNLYERFYSDGDLVSKESPNVRPEDIETLELAVEHHPTATTRLAAALYHYDIQGLISQSESPVDKLLYFKNQQDIHGIGIELEAEQRFATGIRGILSYSLQEMEEKADNHLVNSPMHMVKFQLSTPLWTERLRLGLETLYLGERLAKQGRVDDYWLVNLSFNANVHPNASLAFGLYNMGNVHYADPVGEEYKQNAIVQDGRNIRLKLNLKF